MNYCSSYQIQFQALLKFSYNVGSNEFTFKLWKFQTQKLCFEDFAKVSEDYKRYKKSDFAALEESIAINIFGITVLFL